MNSQSKFSKSTWANGKPAINIDPYSHTPDGFEFVLDRLAQHFSFVRPKADIIGPKHIPEIHNYWAETQIEGQDIVVAMDEYTCSIACETTQLRDKILCCFQPVV